MKDGTTKIVVSGYLMKCGSKRHNWRKRWFVLYGEKLVYSGSHMVGVARVIGTMVEALMYERGAGHETAPPILRDRYPGRLGIRHADTQTRWRDTTACAEYTRVGGVTRAAQVGIWDVYVQDCDDETDTIAVRAERGRGD